MTTFYAFELEGNRYTGEQLFAHAHRMGCRTKSLNYFVIWLQARLYTLYLLTLHGNPLEPDSAKLRHRAAYRPWVPSDYD